MLINNIKEKDKKMIFLKKLSNFTVDFQKIQFYKMIKKI
jgi:hypothetical protein